MLQRMMTRDSIGCMMRGQFKNLSPEEREETRTRPRKRGGFIFLCDCRNAAVIFAWLPDNGECNKQN